MKSQHTKLIVLLLWCSLLAASAQLHLPPMEISGKVGIASFDMHAMRGQTEGSFAYWAPNWQGEVRWNIVQYVSIGVVAATGSSTFKFTQESDGSTSRYDAGHSTFGGSIRLSTGRKPRFRPFVEFGVGKFNLHYKDVERISNSGQYVGYSFGLMIRASKNMYITLPQVSFRSRKSYFANELDGSYVFGATHQGLMDVSAGLVINFGKRG
jgi:hypothetical protein